MFDKNYDIYLSQMAKYALNLLNMIGENFDIYWPQMAKYALKLWTMVGDFFKLTHLKWLNINKLSTVLENIMIFTCHNS